MRRTTARSSCSSRNTTRATRRGCSTSCARSSSRYPAARIYVKEFVNGPPISAPIAVRVIGRDLDVIEKLARAGREAASTSTPGTRDVQNPLKVARTNLQLAVDSQKASLLGVPTVEFDRAVRLSVAGVPTGTFKDPSGEQYDIMVRTPVGARADLDALGAGARAVALRRDAADLAARHAAASRRRPRRSSATTASARSTIDSDVAARLQHREGDGGGREAAGRHELAARLSLRAGRRSAVERGSLRRHRHRDHRRHLRHLRDPRARVRQLQIDAHRAHGRAARRVRRPR